MKKSILRVMAIMLMVVMIVCVLPRTTEAATVKQYMYVTARSGLIGRKGAGTDYAKKTSYAYGQKLWVFRTKGDWSQVSKSKTGSKAWVASRYLSKKDPKASSSGKGTTVGKYMYVTAKSGLVIRKEPSKTSAKRITYDYGSKVWVVRKLNGWAEVKGNKYASNMLGWMSLSYLSTSSPVPSTETATFTYPYMVTADVLNVRKSNSLSAPVIGKMSYGTRVVIMNHNGNWREVVGDSTTGKQVIGWVSASYLKQILQ